MPSFNEKLIYYYKTKDDYPLCIKYAGITLKDKDFYIKRNDSNMYIYEYITEGKGYIEYEGNTYKVGEGDFFSIPTGMTYSYYSDKITPFHKLWFCGDGRLMDCIFNAYFKDKGIIIIRSDYKEAFENILDLLSIYTGSTEDYNKLSTMYFDLMTRAYLDNRETIIKPYTDIINTKDETAIYIKNYIDDNLTGDISLEQLSRQLFMSKVQIIRLFNREFGVTPYSYYLDGKLEIAESLIINTSLQIKEIAKKVGYQDEYYFSHTFRKAKGYSPTSLRKKSK